MNRERELKKAKGWEIWPQSEERKGGIQFINQATIMDRCLSSIGPGSFHIHAYHPHPPQLPAQHPYSQAMSTLGFGILDPTDTDARQIFFDASFLHRGHRAGDGPGRGGGSIALTPPESRAVHTKIIKRKSDQILFSYVIL